MDSPLTDYFIGDLVDGSEHSSDSTRGSLIENWTVRNGEMGLLEEATTVKFECDVFHPSGRATLKRHFDQRLQNMPGLLPHLAHRPAKRPGVASLPAPEYTRRCTVSKTAGPTTTIEGTDLREGILPSFAKPETSFAGYLEQFSTSRRRA